MKVQIYGDSLMKGVLVDENFKYKPVAGKLLQELTAPKPFSRSPEEPIVALLADAQHAAHGAGQRPTWARIKRYLWQGFTACGA